MSDGTLAYLREREQVTDVYLEAVGPVSLLDGSGRELGRFAISSIAGIRNTRAGSRPKRRLSLVRPAAGRSGANIDYVLNTVRHLEEAGIHDAELMALAARLTET